MDNHNNPGWPLAGQNTMTGHRQSNTGTGMNTGNRPPPEHMQNVGPYRGHDAGHSQPHMTRQYPGYEGYYDNSPNMAQGIRRQPPNTLHTTFAAPATGLAHPHQQHFAVTNAPPNTIERGSQVHGQPLSRHTQASNFGYEGVSRYTVNQYASSVYQNPPEGGDRFGTIGDGNPSFYTGHWRDNSLANSQGVDASTAGAAGPLQEAPRQAAAEIPQPIPNHDLAGSDAAVDGGGGDDGDHGNHGNNHGEECTNDASTQPEAAPCNGQQDEAGNEPQAVQSVGIPTKKGTKKREKRTNPVKNPARKKYDVCSTKREDVSEEWADPKQVYDEIADILTAEQFLLENFQLTSDLRITYDLSGRVNQRELSTRHVRALVKYKINLAKQEEAARVKAEQEEAKQKADQEPRQEPKRERLKGFKMWIQNPPNQCKHRLEDGDCQCKWKHCKAVAGHGSSCTICPGSIRVAFDEFPTLTSQQGKGPDPLKPSIAFHLWCFERIFSRREILKLMQDRHLAPDFRPVLGREQRNLFTLDKDGRKGGGNIFENWSQWPDDKLKKKALKMIHTPKPQEPRNPEEVKLEKELLEVVRASRNQGPRSAEDDKLDEEFLDMIHNPPEPEPLDFNDDHLLSLTCLLNLWYSDKIPEYSIKNGHGTRALTRQVRNRNIPFGALSTFETCLGDRRAYTITSTNRKKLNETVADRLASAQNRCFKALNTLVSSKKNQINAHRHRTTVTAQVNQAAGELAARKNELSKIERVARQQTGNKKVEDAKNAVERAVEKAEDSFTTADALAHITRNKATTADSKLDEAVKDFGKARAALDTAQWRFANATPAQLRAIEAKAVETKKLLQIIGTMYEQPASPVIRSTSPGAAVSDGEENNEESAVSPGAITISSASPRVKMDPGEEEEDVDFSLVPAAPDQGSSAAVGENHHDYFDGYVAKPDGDVESRDFKLSTFLVGEAAGSLSEEWCFNGRDYLPEGVYAEAPWKSGPQDAVGGCENNDEAGEGQYLWSIPDYADTENIPEANQARVEEPDIYSNDLDEPRGAKRHRAGDDEEPDIYSNDLDEPRGTKRRRADEDKKNYMAEARRHLSSIPDYRDNQDGREAKPPRVEEPDIYSNDLDEPRGTKRHRADDDENDYAADGNAPEAKRARKEEPHQALDAAACDISSNHMDQPSGTKRRRSDDDDQDGEPSLKRMRQ